jgi:hypothetical protein
MYVKDELRAGAFWSLLDAQKTATCGSLFDRVRHRDHEHEGSGRLASVDLAPCSFFQLVGVNGFGVSPYEK